MVWFEFEVHHIFMLGFNHSDIPRQPQLSVGFTHQKFFNPFVIFIRTDLWGQRKFAPILIRRVMSHTMAASTSVRSYD